MFAVELPRLVPYDGVCDTAAPFWPGAGPSLRPAGSAIPSFRAVSLTLDRKCKQPVGRPHDERALIVARLTKRRMLGGSTPIVGGSQAK